MGRTEAPLDPAEGPVQQFAWELRMLREKAGRPPYRELAERARYSVAALSHAASGRGLPSLPVTLGFVRACGGDPAEWEGRWHAVDDALRLARVTVPLASSAESAVEAETAGAAAPAGTPSDARVARRWRIPVAAAACLLVVAGLAVWLWPQVSGSSHPKATDPTVAAPCPVRTTATGGPGADGRLFGPRTGRLRSWCHHARLDERSLPGR